MQDLPRASDQKVTDQSSVSPLKFTLLFHCSLFPKGSCYVVSQNHVSVPFHGLFSSPIILALTTFLFLVFSSTPHPQNPCCKSKPEPSFMGVKINKIWVWATNHLPKMTVQPPWMGSLWNHRSASTGGCTELHCQWGVPWREEWKIMTACPWEKWKGKNCTDQELWWGPACHTHGWKFLLR